jgi:hypothetical protein
VITIVCKGVYLGSLRIDDTVPIHLEVLLPAFVLGCMLARPAGEVAHVEPDHLGEDYIGPEAEQDHAGEKVSTLVSAAFMVLVGLSMPVIDVAKPTPPAAEVPAITSTLTPPPAADAPTTTPVVVAPTTVERSKYLPFEGETDATLAEKNAFPGWGMIAIHVLAITFLSNLGKMFSAFCYRKEATLYERLAVSVAMFPRGEVGAGVLVVSLSYGIGGPALTVAVLSLALNLLLTGVFILIVKRLITASDNQKAALAARTA